MSGEPHANAASNFMVAMLEWQNSLEEWPENPKGVAADFVRDDRRRGGIGLGRVDRDAALKYSQTAWDVNRSGPIQRVRRMLATRDDRLVAALVEFHLGEWESEHILVLQIDSQLRNLQVVVMFDADDVDAAIAEVDRMYAEIDD